MSRTGRTIAGPMAVLMLASCQATDYRPEAGSTSIHRAPPQREARVKAAPAAPKPASAQPAAAAAKSEVERQIQAWADANNSFPQHRDPQAVMRFYAKDYVQSMDGVMIDYDGLLRQQQSYAEQLAQQGAQTFSIRVKITRLEAAGPDVQADYETFADRLEQGEVRERFSAKCSGLFVKVDERWLLKRETCTSQEPVAAAS